MKILKRVMATKHKLGHALLASVFCAALTAPAVASEAPFAFSVRDRVLVVAPHPDDEALSTGGLIQSAVENKAAVKVVYLTYGDDNEIASLFYLKKPLLLSKDILKMGKVRENEAEKAMVSLGLSPQDLFFLGYPDSGLLILWRRVWGMVRPFRHFLTNIDRVPYADSYKPGSLYRGENIARDLREIIETYRPTHIFVTAPFDRHPDHQAAYLFLSLALLDLREKAAETEVYVYLVHFPEWPPLKGYLPAEWLKAPPPVSGSGRVSWLMDSLSISEVKAKKSILEKYSSEVVYSKKNLMSFVRANELFGRVMPEKAALGTQELLGEPRRACFAVENGELWVSAPLEDFDERGAFTTEIYGWRTNKDFGQMPKLALRLFGNRLFVKDRMRDVFIQGILFKLEKNRVLIRVPLAALGAPEVIFTRMETSSEKASLDFGSSRILEISA